MKYNHLAVLTAVLWMIFNVDQLRAGQASKNAQPSVVAIKKEHCGHHAYRHFVTYTAVDALSAADALRNAYAILKTGDHDYQGHRIKAMHEIEAAAKYMGVTLRGDVRDKTPQALSDEKLREARGLLETVKVSGSAKSPRQVVWRIDDAIKEINFALSIR